VTPPPIPLARGGVDKGPHGFISYPLCLFYNGERFLNGSLSLFFFFVLYVRVFGISILPPAVNFFIFCSLLYHWVFIMGKRIRKISLLFYVGIMLKLIPTMNKFILGEFHLQKNALFGIFQPLKGQKKTPIILGKSEGKQRQAFCHSTHCLRKSFGSQGDINLCPSTHCLR
jgi:hypothetical protein